MQKIQDTLLEIREKEKVNIVLASECGSRLFNTHSPTSDYDVRFIYIRPLSNYILAIDDDNRVLDINNCKLIQKIKEESNIELVGFDIKKVIQLISKNNIEMYYAIESPVRYVYNERVFLSLCSLMSANFDFYDYVECTKGVAKNNFKKYIYAKEDEAPIKKYIHVIRCLLSAMYIQRFKKLPPFDFRYLVDLCLKTKMIKEEEHKSIVKIINIKKGKSKGNSFDWHCLLKLINEKLEKIEKKQMTLHDRRKPNIDINNFNSVYQQLITTNHY